MLVNNTGNFIRRLGNMKLVPGVNEITEEQWKACLKHKLFKKALIDTGIVVSLSEKKEKPVTDITEIKAEEAIPVIYETFNTILLTEWQEKETRKTVLKAIEKQFDTLYGKEDEEE